ncbi:NAD(P)/FAD-dependent oxidoreductase [Ottowia thiooxydans]|uniref:NAD(P)/FAD-dependent oxidoreductase n=1 Tax=Ottowia thiooxydans TaxID=219182 RepID=UPI0003FF083A|nr:FAD-dependent oxidoreductase [Ottowia thiooxydans]
MIRLAELRLPLTQADAPESALRALAAQKLQIAETAIHTLEVFKRSFDARKAELLAVYIVDLSLAEPAHQAALLAQFEKDPHVQATPDMTWRPPVQAPANWLEAPDERPVVIGFGPCGIFAALVLAQMGLKPIVLERGKPVRERTQDTWGLWRKSQLNPESNVQFGEGGAGLFSDGKLYSQVRDPRHLGRKVMQEFVTAGAPEEILWVAHPHVGTFKLVKVVESLRDQITALGGEIRFQQRVTDLILEGEEDSLALRGLEIENLETGEHYKLPARRVVMALGHSSRDTFGMLYRRKVDMVAKPYSVGVRIEHPQGVIDRARWGRHAGHPLLGAADYKLVHHAGNGRTVYSFCMCPGGTVVAATSEPGRVVTNGMSQYSRNERNANAGMVVGIDPSDFPRDPAAFVETLGESFGVEHLPADQTHPLAGIVLQRQLEASAYLLGGANYTAPAQRVGDFLAQRPSTEVGEVIPSYKPGVHWIDLHALLPDWATAAMREALPAFARKIKGYDMADAVMTGVETRTSSPVNIRRGENLQSLNVRGLFPAGEGAGYAGGILSAGIDGIKVGEALAVDWNNERTSR